MKIYNLIMTAFVWLHCITNANAQVTVYGMNNSIKVDVSYNDVNNDITFSIENKSGETITINDKKTNSMPGSSVNITFLKTGDSDKKSGYTLDRRLGDSANFIELPSNQILKYLYNVTDLKSRNSQSNRIRIKYCILYHITENESFCVKEVKGEKIFYMK